MPTHSLLWYDLETTGRDPARDRILQFAAQRTDLDFNPIGKPWNVLCKPPRDAMPDPEAIALTGISFDQCEDQGLLEYDFTQTVLEAFSHDSLCILGYNNLRFDDEFLRHLFYRNLKDPYAREWQDNRSRWDLIDVVRLCRALRPEGINWPVDQNGIANNKLENLSTENALPHASAHDALSDVQATIAVAKLLKTQQPKLYDYAFSNRDKASCASALSQHKPEPVLHISGMYGSDRNYTAVVMPIAQHPLNKNGVLVADLQYEIDEFKSLSTEQLRTRWFGKSSELDGTPRLPIKTIHLNRCPALAPLSVIRDNDAHRLGLELSILKSNAAGWLDARFIAKLHEILANPQFDESPDPELQLYAGGFFSPRDRRLMDEVARLSPKELSQFDGALFDDPRLPTLLARLRARNWPSSLSDNERAEWDAWRSKAVDDPTIRSVTTAAFQAAIARIRTETPTAAPLMDQLQSWYEREFNSR